MPAQHTWIFTALLSCLLATSIVLAKSSLFPDTKEVGKKTLVLNGTGLCEWGVFEIDLYRAGLYLEKRSSIARDIIDSADMKSLELSFLRKISRKQMQKAYRVSFKRNTGKRYPSFEKRVEQLCTMLSAVEPGDRLEMNYLPGVGTEVRFNGGNKGVISGQDFGRMVFTLYLGASPPDPNLRNGLLSLDK